MEILFFAPHLKISGGAKVIYSMAEEMIRRGHTVKVALHKTSSNFLWNSTENPKFEIVKTPYFSKYTLPKADVMIHFGDGETFGNLPDVPQVLYLQGFGTMNYTLESVNLMYPYAGVITTSKWLHSLARRSGHKKVYIAPPGIDKIFFDYNPVKFERNFTVGCLYHESPSKNIDFFVAAMQKMTVLVKRFQVLFLSTKEPNEKKGLFNGVTFDHSFCIRPPRHLIPYIYSSCNAWCSVSLSEGFGLPIVEAMAVGTPTVVVPSFGLDEYLSNGHNCILVPNGNKDKLCSAVLDVGRKGETRARIIKGGKKLANAFTWNNAGKAFDNALKDIVGK